MSQATLNSPPPAQPRTPAMNIIAAAQSLLWAGVNWTLKAPPPMQYGSSRPRCGCPWILGLRLSVSPFHAHGMRCLRAGYGISPCVCGPVPSFDGRRIRDSCARGVLVTDPQAKSQDDRSAYSPKEYEK